MNETLLTTGDLADQLGIPRWRLIYLLDRGNLPDTTLRVRGRRLFTSTDVKRIQAALRNSGQKRSAESA